MSIEIYVLSDKSLNSIAEWQEAIKREGVDLRLEATRPIEALSGYLPAYRGAQHAGFECDHFDLEKLRDEIAGLDPQRQWSSVLAFRFGGDPGAAMSAYLAASSYARASGGVVFDGEQGETISPQRAAEIAREIEASLPAIAAAVQATLALLRADKERPS